MATAMQAPVRLHDILLVSVVISSMVAAIVFPAFGARFDAFPFYCLMINFTLSYLSIDLASVWKALRGHGLQIVLFTGIKLAVLPVVMYFAFLIIAPPYALGVLLLSGVSVGVVSPMISNMVRGNSSLVLVVVVVTSILAPFTLPVLIELLASRDLAFSFPSMLRMLVTVIFIPILIVEAIRYFLPRVVAPIMKVQFPVSLLMFALINLGVFHRYAAFFRQEPQTIAMAIIIAIALAALFSLVGILFFIKGSLENQLAGAVMTANINFVLVIVFASEFFGPVEALLAAMYIIPFFFLVIPLRYYRYRKTRLP